MNFVEVDENGWQDAERELVLELEGMLADSEGRLYFALWNLVANHCPNCDSSGTMDYGQETEDDFFPIQCDHCGPILTNIRERLALDGKNQ